MCNAHGNQSRWHETRQLCSESVPVTLTVTQTSSKINKPWILMRYKTFFVIFTVIQQSYPPFCIEFQFLSQVGGGYHMWAVSWSVCTILCNSNHLERQSNKCHGKDFHPNFFNLTCSTGTLSIWAEIEIHARRLVWRGLDNRWKLNHHFKMKELYLLFKNIVLFSAIKTTVCI